MKYKVLFSILVILLLSCTGILCAQTHNSEIDSLNYLIETHKDDTIKVNALIDLGTRSFWGSDDSSKVFDLGRKALSLARKLGYKRGEGYALRLLGKGYKRTKKYSESFDNFRASLSVFEAIDNKYEISYSLSEIGGIYFILGDEDKWIEYFLASLIVTEEIGDKIPIAAKLMDIGNLFLHAKKYSEALPYFQKALTLWEELEDKVSVGVSGVSIGLIYFNKQNYDSALIYFKTYVKNFEGLQEAAYWMNYIGEIYALQNDFENAFKFHYEAVRVAEKFDSKLFLTQSLLSLASTQKKKGELRKSIQTYLRAQKISEEINALSYAKKSYQELASSYSESRDYKNAYFYNDLLVKAKDSLYTRDYDDMKNKLKMNFRIIEVDALAKEKAAKQIQLQKDRINLGITLGLIILVGGASVRFYQVRRSKRIIEAEKSRSENLLLNILPQEVADELKETGTAKAKAFTMVTVMFTDFKDFTTISEKVSAELLVDEIHYCFSAFDGIIQKYKIEKIKTIGDSYLCASGIPVTTYTHAIDMINAAIEIRDFVEKRKEEKEQRGEIPFEIRIGIHTGPVVAGIVGIKKYAYDIWGDTVNIAARMEQNSEAGKINISGSTYELVKGKYEFEHRGKIEAKNKGMIDMYFVSKHENPI